MKKSLNQIRVELEEIATAHDQINTFFWGDPLRAWEEMEPEYPMMNCFVPDSSMLYNETEIQFTIVVSDKHYKDWNENLNDVESDTLQIIRDIYQVINKSTRWQKFGTVESASASKFINDTGDEVAGWSMTVNFRLRDNSGVCGLPMTDYDFNREISEGCADAEYTVEYENGTEIESGTIPSGESKLIIVPNPSACDPATVQLNGVTMTTIPSGDTENIQVLQSDDMTEVGSKQGTHFRIDDSTITLEGGAFTTVKAEGTVDITIVDQNGNTPTINGTTGSEIEIQMEGYNAGKCLQTGQTVSYNANGYDQPNRGRLIDFFNLNYTNEWGHDFRFCGATGGYTDGVNYYDVSGVATSKALAFPNDIIFDFAQRNSDSVLSFYIGDSTTFRNWLTAIPLHVGSTFGGLTGWYLWNDAEMNSVRNVQSFNTSTHWMSYPPFEFTASQRYFITATRDTATVIRTDFRSIDYIGSTTETNALLNVFVRYTLLTELGL